MLLALTPVEGILFGEADREIQTDPLYLIFNDSNDQSDIKETIKHKIFHSSLLHGSYLTQSCSQFAPSTYETVDKERQAKRMVVSTLQYIALDSILKSIGAYAKKLNIDAESYKNLSANLVTNFCTKNLTLISREQIKSLLAFYYENPFMDMIPTVNNSPYITEKFKIISESQETRGKEFELLIRNFRNFCSWGGDVEDFRMLAPYLNNKFIMSHVITNLTGNRFTYNTNDKSVSLRQHTGAVQVSCDNLICRRSSHSTFLEKFPLSVGSTGLYQDLVKLYCHTFKTQDYRPAKTIAQVKEWQKKQELEDPYYDVSFLFSLLTRVPDPTFGMENYQEIPFLAKSSIDEKWNLWAQKSLGRFSSDLLFEESLKVKSVPRRNPSLIRENLFAFEFNITLGEMDNIVDETDKLSAKFNLELSKNFLRNAIVKWNVLSKNLDEEGKKLHKEDLRKYIDELLKPKKKLFRQTMWTEDFSGLIVDELLSQLNLYQGRLFESYKDEMLQVPVKFNYGVFALGYLRYRADVQSGRLKLTL